MVLVVLPYEVVLAIISNCLITLKPVFVWMLREASRLRRKRMGNLLVLPTGSHATDLSRPGWPSDGTHSESLQKLTKTFQPASNDDVEAFQKRAENLQAIELNEILTLANSDSLGGHEASK